MSIHPPPSLVDLTHAVHEQFRDGGEAVIAVVEHRRELAFGVWSPPDPAGRLVDSLVGWLAPFGIDHLGASTRHEGQRLTTLADLHGGICSVADGAEPVETPILLADALDRCLGRATPPPPVSIATWLDLAWLDRLPERIYSAEHPLGSDELLALHPLHESGLTDPEQLRERVVAVDASCSWADVRERWLGPADVVAQPPGGLPIEPSHWFDDGSFCRSRLGSLAPPDQVLADLTTLLSPSSLSLIGAGLAGLVRHR